ncbi:MAG: hypothetical protein AAF432_01785 [Planctomycetota bacterium]
MTDDFSDDGGHWRYEFTQPGINEFTGYYPDGTVREQGTILISMVDILPSMPLPDGDPVTSQCFKPDGSLGSEVVDGTGVQTIWLADGTKVWELHLKNSSRVHLRSWHDNGQLNFEYGFKDNHWHGPYVRYHRNGQLQTQGQYERSEKVGIWTYYDEQGIVASTEDHGTPE